MIIDHIKTDLFSLGCFGRSGSRSLADFLSGYYSDYVKKAVRIRFLYEYDKLDEYERGIVLKSHSSDKILRDMIKHGFVPHHYHSMTETDDFNSYKNKRNPKIMVLRHPLERAKSGSVVKLEQAFHGMPSLFSVDFDAVDYVIDFNRINDYTDGVKLGSSEDTKLTIDLLKNNGDTVLYTEETMVVNWDPSDYEYDADIDIYNDMLETKEHLPADLWKSLVRNFNDINLPTRLEGVTYRK